MGRCFRPTAAFRPTAIPNGAEISELDPDEPIKEARMRRYLIRGVKEYTPFLTSIQGWADQPSIVELENLLTNQEALAMQMAKASISENDVALFTRKQRHNNYNYKSWKAHNPKGAADWKENSSISDEQEINKLKDELAIRFEMKNLGELKHFLGLEVSRCKEGILVSQGQYAKKILEKFKMINCRPAATPMEHNLKLRANVGKELKNVKTYCTLVGSLIYLTITRPDISFPVRVVSQLMQKPRKPHLDAANRILRYLKPTMNYGLMYKQGVEILLSGFTDADWAGDTSSRRSTSGYTFDLGSAAISWCSKKQATVALSSTEAEYNAATLAAQECVYG